jgi:hypothetical protein
VYWPHSDNRLSGGIRAKEMELLKSKRAEWGVSIRPEGSMAYCYRLLVEVNLVLFPAETIT